MLSVLPAVQSDCVDMEDRKYSACTTYMYMYARHHIPIVYTISTVIQSMALNQ